MDIIANKRTYLRPGSMVIIAYPLNERTNNPAHKLEGETMVVKSVKEYPKATSIYRRMFTLYGAVSEKGMPYWFLEDELIPI